MEEFISSCEIRLDFLSRALHLGKVNSKLLRIDSIVGLLFLLLALAARDWLLEGRGLLCLFLQGFHLLAKLASVDCRSRRVLLVHDS